MLSFTRAVRTPSFDTPLGPPDSDHGSTLALALALNLALGLPCPCFHTSSPSPPPLPLSASALLLYSIYLRCECASGVTPAANLFKPEIAVGSQ